MLAAQPGDQIRVQQHTVLDPVARKIIDIDPWVSPNRVTTPNANGPVENITYGEKARVFNEMYSVRIDHQIRENLKLNGTWSYNHGNGAGRPPRNIRNIDFDAADGATTPSNNQNFSIGTNWILSAPWSGGEIPLRFTNSPIRARVFMLSSLKT